MTYGLDECRVCGKPIKIYGPENLARYENDRARPPVWPEAKWREAGFKACPTRWQLAHPADGCCSDCAIRLQMKQVAPLRKAAGLAACAVAMAAFVYVVAATFN
jgi:hypothetical protein